MSNVLDLLDQTIFDVSRATGRPSLLQCVWVYDRPVDLDGLRRFHEHLQRGRLSRRIARSPLPFGRHRWVAPDHLPELEIVESARPRKEFEAWLTEQGKTPLDCEHGPGWHLAVLPFTDGGAGVSFVISHCLTDGVGLCEALADAARGRDDPISWPAAAARRRWQALREDAGQTARDIPAMGRAVVAAVRLARRSRGGTGAATPRPATPAPATPPALPAGADERIVLPMATVFVDADEWEARAQALGGSSTALLAGFAARLAQRVGRVAADGSVVVMMPVNERAADDTRANAISNVGVTVDPARATIDLREIRTAIKQAWIRHRKVPDEERAVNAIVPLLPKRLLGGASVAMVGFASNVVGSSNLGVVNPAAGRPDGTDANYFAMRNIPVGVTTATMYRRGGAQLVVLGRSHGHVFVSALAYQPGRHNSNDGLRQDLSSTLNDFSLTGTHL
ncbi:hypothetical protein [Mycolicibacterium sp. HK-90]|uniref:hypothetical protein n=1 Tax=Mycolicibacterium sp. HK-90 TaxID=3056937 RepID=UPI002658FE0F|nr:hypothetical protein [Mycolicibacterium sp. HK-90]WKG02811.1 hypothetical protein QU592_27065 [Mycolicibacterium sp. HK-90]